MSYRWRTLALLALACAAAPCVEPAAAQQAPPPIPPLPTIERAAFPDDARAQIDAALDAASAHPDAPDTVGQLALTLHAWEEFESADAAYRRAQALAPGTVDWWYFGGLLASRRGLHDQAARQFRRALAVQPSNALIALRLADAALDAGEVDEARTLYDPLTTRPETAPAAWYGLGRVRQAAGDRAGAREAYGRAVALYPEFGGAHYALAQLYRRDGDREAARAALQRQQQCLACWPVPPDPWRARLGAVRSDPAALLQRGVATAGDTSEAAAAEAIRLHERAIDQDATLGQAHVNLIELYARTGNLAQASTHYQAAAALPGFAAEAHRAWGWVLLRQRRADEAAPALTEAVTLAPTNAQALNGLGLALELTGRPAEAVDVYAKAVAAAPAARDVRFNLARTLVQLGRLPAAIAELERLRQPVDAETPRYLFALSVAYVREGDNALGLQVGEEAASLATQFGLTDLAQAIGRDLATLRSQAPR